jgi:hypothetical protein
MILAEELAEHRAEVRHIEPGGVGYTQGYTTASLFLSEVLWETLVPFMDFRAHAFNSGNPAFNTGGGVRFVASELIFGGNVYYDYRKTSHASYSQVTIGFEALSQYRDVRVNAYIPFGDKNTMWASKQEFAMPGANVEVGKTFELASFAVLYGAVGVYYFARSSKHAMGGELRASVQFFDHVKIEGFASYDPVFKAIGQGEFSLVFPFGPKRKVRGGGDRSLSEQESFQRKTFQPISRYEMIVVDTKGKLG